jgi:hypothetical protein
MGAHPKILKGTIKFPKTGEFKICYYAVYNYYFAERKPLGRLKHLKQAQRRPLKPGFCIFLYKLRRVYYQ